MKARNPLFLILGASFGFFLLFLIASGALYFSKQSKVGSGQGAATFFGRGAIGVIEINGVILDSKKILKTLERFSEDEEIKAVVVRVNSPGGAVAPSQEVFNALRKYNKPVVSSMSSVAASGGYYIACGTQKIFALPGSLTGSIGVIMEFANLEKLYEWAKIKRYSIKTGKFKDSGAEYREMTTEDRALLQAMVDDVLMQFKRAVSEGRKLSMTQVSQVADGRIFSGAQAKAAKLVDELGGLTEAIEAAAKMAGIKGKPEVVYPEKRSRFRLLDFLLSDSSPDDEAESSGSYGEGSSFIQKLLLTVFETPRNRSFGPGLYLLWSGGF